MRHPCTLLVPNLNMAFMGQLVFTQCCHSPCVSKVAVTFIMSAKSLAIIFFELILAYLTLLKNRSQTNIKLNGNVNKCITFVYKGKNVY